MPTHNTRNNSDGGEVFVISVAAELAGMHAQTLRTYDRMGLVIPQRTRGGGRRYSRRDVDVLREIQRLSQEEGVNLAGIKALILSMSLCGPVVRSCMFHVPRRWSCGTLTVSAGGGRIRGRKTSSA